MKILADENRPGPVVQALRKRGHDVVWAQTDCPGLKDRALLERAEAEERIIFTLDQDFWQLALQRPVPIRRCGVILFRAFPAISKKVEALVESVLRTERSWAGHVSIVRADGVEMIPGE